MPTSGLGLDWTRMWASRRRSRGHYTRETLAAYFAAWQQRPTAPNLLAWLAFRRDLGRPAPMRFVPLLRTAMAQLDAPRRRLALGLLAEVAPGALEGLNEKWLKDAGSRLPGVATQVAPEGALAQLALRQAGWQHTFATAFANAALNGGVQVVGNAASLRSRLLGSQLDAAGWVIRFNQFATGPEWCADVGERLDVWVVSPGYSGPVPSAARWVVVSGPQVLFRLQDWRLLLPFAQRGTPVLTVPLWSWRACVSTLKAPPSAGVLLLHWLRCLNAGHQWQGIRSAGIGLGASAPKQPYHLALGQHKPGQRHAWAAEARLMHQWAGEGLCRLDAVAPATKAMQDQQRADHG